MKQIILKKLGEDKKEGRLVYSEMIKSILQYPQDRQSGFTIDEIRTNVKIIESLEKNDEVLVLEDSQYEFLKQLISRAKFAIAHKNVVEFVDDIMNAKNVDLNKEVPDGA